jgi:hypothetical protein
MRKLSYMTDREFGRLVDHKMDQRLDEYLDPIPVFDMRDIERPEPDCREDCREFPINW